MVNGDYGEIFCQAAEILVKNLIDKVSYDKTILCTIIKDDDKALGKYRVENGETQFDAYTSDTTLRENDEVYVQIPNGDWNEQKLIVSKKVNTINEPMTYHDPFTSFISITNNLIKKDIDTSGLIANDDIVKQISLWSYNKPQSNSIVKDGGESLSGYTRLGLSASFQSWLQDLGVVKGDYGLTLLIELEPEDKDEQNTLEEEVIDNPNIKYCQLTCNDMLGNPYGYDGYYPQKKLFDISGLKKIQSLELYFYQKAGSFYNYEDKPILVSTNTPANIFVKDISLFFGYDTNSFEDDTLIIYTMDSEKYNAQNFPHEKNHKKLYARWIHKFADGSVRVVNQNDQIYYELYWYRYEQGAKSHTVWSGVDWIPLSSQIFSDEGLKYNILDSKWKTYNYDSATETDTPIRNIEYNQSWLLPDINKAEEKIKVILTYDTEILYSNILLFSNSNDVISPATLEATQALTINCEDNSSGNYLIYDIGGKILDGADSQKTREFKAYFNSALSNTNIELAELIEASKIEWIIPAQNTMIDLTGFTSNDPEEDGYYHIIRYGDKSKNNDIKNQNSQRYKIKNHFSQTYNNNTIKCVVTRNEIEYVSYKELTFGPAGTSGTNYTFVLDFMGSNQALTLASDYGKDEVQESLIVRARLYDYTGKEITGLETKDISWSVNQPNHVTIISRTNKNEIELQLADFMTDVIPTNHFAIVKATLKEQYSNDSDEGWGDYELCAYLPIPVRKSRKYKFISGTTSVVYNSFGELDRSNFQNPYYLYYVDPNEEEFELKLIKGPWGIYSREDGDPYAPSLRENKSNGEYTLKPVNMYIESENDYACVYCYQTIKDDLGKDINDILWAQPIYITQNKYPTSIINDWNGELTIDNENNAILAAKVAAGKKNDDNTFSGVMMGDWSGNDTSSAEGAITKNTGIYGFQKGVASFGFRDDGTAFIGKPGKGRLEFDGDKSIIQSNTFALGYGGMSLDFDAGLIEMYEPGLSHNDKNNHIKINVKEETTPFTIGGSTPKFKVNWDGTIYASDGIFEGKITSTEGEIGGWEIGETTLTGGGVTLKSSDGSITGASIYGANIYTGALHGNNTNLIDLDGYLTVSATNSSGEEEKGKLGQVTGGSNAGGLGIGMETSKTRVVATSGNAGLSYFDSEGSYYASASGQDAVLGYTDKNNKTTNVRIQGHDITITGNTLKVVADNQEGIYARFA